MSRKPSWSPLETVLLTATDQWQKAGDKAAEIIGGTAKVWGPQELLIEDAGPGLHVHFMHSGDVLEIAVGNGQLDEVAAWLERAAQTIGAKIEDPKTLVRHPDHFAQALCTVLSEAGLRCRIRGHKAIVAGRRDIGIALGDLFNKRTRQAFQAYFGFNRDEGKVGQL